MGAKKLILSPKNEFALPAAGRYEPLVSIVIPVYNGAAFLDECIKSAISQTYRNIEILVINDGSTDKGASRRIAESYGSKVNYFEKANGGVASALNMAINLMRGAWFSWLSHDDLYYPDKIEKQVSHLNRILNLNRPSKLNKIVLYGNVEHINEDGSKLALPKIKLADGLSTSELILQNIKRNQFGGCTFLLPKACFTDVGEFNTDLRTMCDYEMWYRLLLADYEFHYLPDVLVSNRMHKNQLTHTKTDQCKQEYYLFHSWLLNTLTGNEKYGRPELIFKLGIYMKRRNIPIAKDAFMIVRRKQPASIWLDLRIGISKMTAGAYYYGIHIIKKAYAKWIVKCVI